MQALEHHKGRVMTGMVISDKNDKTIVVRVETLVKQQKKKRSSLRLSRISHVL